MPPLVNCRYRLSDIYQFDVEDEGGAAGDAGDGALAVAHLGGQVDFPAVANMHLLQGDDPALDEFAESACEGRSAST